ncbi:helix-turn-helix domain-containing protein [Thioclava sp. F28-4]|uniref:helix-turn-helix domain-containing protein n=1 Tax=Thioclava sp. F28-4 TaxID=1915315 RepID=UPI000998DD10|nr:helix-turn-helix domain-containing protein [Thioclava sp. F28-4]OOY02700.1 hypothetical protein BMI87_21555 [Thioclava sp. F28-4]
MSFQSKQADFTLPSREVMTEPEAADFLRIGLTKIREMRRKKEIPHVPGKPVVYMRASLISWLSGREVKPIAMDEQQEQKALRKAPRHGSDKAAIRALLLT